MTHRPSTTSVPSPCSSWGTFVTSSAHVFDQKQKLKIDFNFQFSIFNFDFDFLILDSSKTEKLSRVTYCNIVGKTKLPLLVHGPGPPKRHFGTTKGE